MQLIQIVRRFVHTTHINRRTVAIAGPVCRHHWSDDSTEGAYRDEGGCSSWVIMNMYVIERSLLVWRLCCTVLRMRWMIEHDQGYILNQIMSKHTPSTQRTGSLRHIKYHSLTCSDLTNPLESPFEPHREGHRQCEQKKDEFHTVNSQTRLQWITPIDGCM